ncbi:MAG: ABC transporter permease [Chloroflexi bacterium]|nr:ABC transporter permease [Chloroflexota bacterium]
MDKIKTIMFKEWSEVFKNRTVLFSIIFTPMLFTALPLLILFFSRGDVTGMGEQVPPEFMRLCPPGLSPGECLQVYLLSQFMLLFMLMPVMIPVHIAAYSIVGEKSTRSLEPLLATPISTAELLAGKNLAAAIPAVLATWLSFGLYGLGARMLAPNPRVLAAIMDPMWLAAIFVAGPLLAVLSVNFALMVSSRVNDPRIAEQLSAAVMMPVLLLFFGQILGLVFLTRQLVVMLSAVLLVVDALLLYLAVRLFQRESILTRWR